MVSWDDVERRMSRVGVLCATSLIVFAAACDNREESPAVGADLSVAVPDINLECEGCDLVLISLDTVRADHLGIYGYSRNTSPNIDEFAAKSILFERAHSTAHSTAPSHMSMFTSMHPSVHGVTNSRNSRFDPLHDGFPTVTQILKEEGYRAAAFTGGGQVSPQFGFSKGFDLYRSFNTSTSEAGTREAIDEAISFMRAHREEKLFVFLHTYHAHDPYTPNPPYDKLFDPEYAGPIQSDINAFLRYDEMRRINHAYWLLVDKSDAADVRHLKALYDGEIAELDAMLRKFLTVIETERPNSIVIITSDHGEEFGEHGKFTHHQLYQELLHVPLIIRHPQLDRGIRISRRVSLLGLTPTILELLEIDGSHEFQGTSLLRPQAREEIFAEQAGSGRTLIVDERKLLWRGAKSELYDLSSDPGETRNMAAADATVNRLRERMDEISQANSARRATVLRASQSLPATLDPEVVEQLEALGYID
jgi:arylsulfatase A-like enzyme